MEGELVMYVSQSSDRKVTNKIALNGYAYTKRGGTRGISYWYCDQRKICGASLIEKNGVFTSKEDNSTSYSSRRLKSGWGTNGNHESHPPDLERINKEISTRARRLEKRKRASERRALKEGIQFQSETEEVNLSAQNQANIYPIEIKYVDDHEECDDEVPGPRIENVCTGSRNLLDNPDNTEHDDSVIPVLIDTDGGFYDAWALALALKSSTLKSTQKKFKIVGITTVNGCTTVQNAVQNVGKVVNTIGGNARDTPVFEGMESPILGSKEKTPRPAFFGSDGFGDTLPPSLPQESPNVVQDVHGVNAIIKLANNYKGKLTILALGPLTNLAMAVKLQPDIRNYVKEIFILGGNCEGQGNVTVCGEFNFFADPEAAHIVLSNFTACPLYLLPWETCTRSAASSQLFRTKEVGQLNTPLMSLFNKVESKILNKHRDHWVAPDAVLVACFVNPEVIRKTEHYHCAVELQGKHTRGMTIVDKNFLNQKPANALIITEVDRKMYEEMLVLTVGHDSQSILPQDDFAVKLQQNYF